MIRTINLFIRSSRSFKVSTLIAGSSFRHPNFPFQTNRFFVTKSDDNGNLGDKFVGNDIPTNNDINLKTKIVPESRQDCSGDHAHDNNGINSSECINHSHDHTNKDGHINANHDMPQGCGHDHEHGKLDLFHSHGVADKSVSFKQILSEQAKEAKRITLIGVCANVSLCIVKGVTGALSGSLVMLADCLHTLSDLVSDFTTYVCISLSRKLPSLKFPFGSGKIEDVGSLFVGGSLFTFGYELLGTAFKSINEKLSTGVVNVHSNFILNPDLIQYALVAGIVSVVVKEIIFRYTRKVGKKIDSTTVIANAFHHRSDAITSLVSVASITLTMFGYPAFDVIGGILMGIYNLCLSYKIMKPAFLCLIDYKIPDKEYAVYKNTVQESLSHYNYSLSKLLITKSGGYCRTSLDLITYDNMTVSEYTNNIDQIKKYIQSKHVSLQYITINIIYKPKNNTMINYDDNNQNINEDGYSDINMSIKSSNLTEEHIDHNDNTHK